MSDRKIRRAAAHEARKLARKAGLPSDQISEAQLAANRANAQKSTGPTSETGRTTSSQNRTTHGLARHNGVFALLPTEDPNGFEALKAALAAEHQPATETESILVNTMAESHWLANRAQTLQAACFDPQTGQVADTARFNLYLRYQSTHTRAFHKALNDLAKQRAEKRKIQNGFEASKGKQGIKNETQEHTRVFQDPEFLADVMRVAVAKLGKDPNYDRLYAEFFAKYCTQAAPQEGATAQAAA